jgi:hypothetical protein
MSAVNEQALVTGCLPPIYAALLGEQRLFSVRYDPSSIRRSPGLDASHGFCFFEKSSSKKSQFEERRSRMPNPSLLLLLIKQLLNTLGTLESLDGSGLQICKV